MKNTFIYPFKFLNDSTSLVIIKISLLYFEKLKPLGFHRHSWNQVENDRSDSFQECKVNENRKLHLFWHGWGWNWREAWFGLESCSTNTSGQIVHATTCYWYSIIVCDWSSKSSGDNLLNLHLHDLCIARENKLNFLVAFATITLNISLYIVNAKSFKM